VIDTDIVRAMKASNLAWLESCTIFLTKHGSQAYGTSTPESDTDYKGICIEPPEYYMGMNQHFEQAEFHRPDAAIFSLRKFMKLASNCNPSVIEILFTSPEDWLMQDSSEPNFKAFVQLFDARHLFLSKKARFTFSGYAMSQLKRIRTHHRWLVDPPDHEPTRSEFQLPDRTAIPFDQLLAAEASIRTEMDALYNVDLDLDDVGNIKLKSGLEALKNRVAAVLAGANDTEAYIVGKQLGFGTNFLLHLDHERAYKNARIEWEQFTNWKKTRNPARAELEAKFGYDTKHAMHLVRLMRMGREILRGEGVRVRRPDAEELLRIRAGDWNYEWLLEWARDMEAHMVKDYEESRLPHGADHKKLEALCIQMYDEYNHRPTRGIV
jgi:uncharacterized protein